MPKKKRAFPAKVSELKVPSDYSPTCQGCTQSMLGCFLTCEQKWMYKLNRLRPEGPTKGAFVFGGLMHHILAALLRGLAVTAETLAELMEQYKEIEERNYHLDQQEYEQHCGFVEALIPYYEKVYKRELKTRTFTHVETSMEAMGEYFMWRGKVDGLYVPVKQHWLLEHKTMGRIDEEGVLFALMLDTQLRLYDWLVEHSAGIQLAGCLFDVIRTPQLRRKQSETLQQFVRRIYDDIGTRPDFYFKQWEVRIGQRERKQFADKLTRLEDRMMRVLTGEELPLQNSYACRTPARQCEFLPFCATDSTTGLVQQRYVHPELEI